MLVVNSIVAFVFILVAAILFLLGLVKLYQNNQKARCIISSGYAVGLVGVIIAVILFGFFSL